MERQRSFTLKSTRFLVFSFTISSSIIFLTFFSFWVFKFNPSIRQETHLGLNKSFRNLGLTPSTVQALTGFTGNFSEISILNDTYLSVHRNTTRYAEISVSDGLAQQNESRVSEDQIPAVEVMLEASPEKLQVSGGEAVEDVKREASSYEKLELLNSDGNEERHNRTTSIERIGGPSTGSIVERRTGDCDITVGKWVYDESYPLYTNGSCPFIDEGFNCQSNGRQDLDYTKWRWQPRDCDIPRFNAPKMLDLIRGKRMVFVGDSINRNQWESMLCMLMGAIKDPKRVYETRGRRITKEKGNYSFKFVDYRCTVEYYVTHFLVHESKARVGRKRAQTLRIDTIDRGSSRWKGADILIFNTAHWWSHHKTKAGINYYQEGDQVYPRLDVKTAFRRALMTWASWVDKHINPRKTQVFFRSSSPSHFSGGQWNSGGHCMEASRPLNNTISIGYPEKNIIAEEVLKLMKTPVTYLNVTRVSEFRIDGHPSLYGRKTGKSLSIQDCSHWCLPGVPDVWNELLYFHLQTKQSKSLH
ncbi:protein YLS7-like [Tripterygium wilfordii]|uniref:Protein YLS7-like n=1 Tax=Tripterygium wilfordii TaxID=458696 RepID=A0A7J7D5A9_TRIWF|nr:protein trichome birefringence-like 6 [Tripterygium wilfordii]KAF5741524.1 protein YLS7-like [Tripterygium wilfordii]